MKDLEENILEEIEIFEETSFRELEFLKNNDWTTLGDRNTRIEQHKFQKEIVSRNLTDAGRFSTLCKLNSSHPKVKETLAVFREFLTLYSERFDSYKKLHDWTKYKMGGPKGKKPEDVQFEIAFQSEIIKNLHGFKNSWKKIDSDSSLGTLSIDIFRNTPLPLIFEDMAREYYPEIDDYLEQRKEKENYKK